MRSFKEGSGKSHSFFFFTEDHRFVIKTLKKDELNLLARKGLLEKFSKHLDEQPNSLLSRFYGIFNVKIKHTEAIDVIIMDNVQGEYKNHIERVFDLKGSIFKRNLDEETKRNKPQEPWKDKDFLECKDEYHMITNTAT